MHQTFLKKYTHVYEVRRGEAGSERAQAHRIVEPL